MLHTNSKIPKLFSWFFRVAAITIGEHIFTRDEFPSPRLLTHERIHVLQGRELGLSKFWFLYVVYWLKALPQTRDLSTAYRRIPFEREAYANDSDPEYLFRRKPFAWKNYEWA